MDAKKAKTVTKRGLPTDVKVAVKAGQAKKGEEILVLDLRGAASFTDFFVIMHGNSSRQNAAISETIEQELKASGVRPLGVEGTQHGEWILMDYGNFVVHIFSKQARDYYSLEKLWADAPKISF